MSDFTKTKYSMTAEAKAFFAREDVRAFIDAIRAEFPDAQFCDDTYSSTIDPAVRVPGLIVYSAALDRYVSASIGAMGTVRSWLDPEHVKSCIDRRYWDNAFLSGRAYCDENGEAIGAAGAGERFLVDGPYVHGDGRPVYRATDAAMSVLNGYSAEWVRAELDLGRFLYECEGIAYAWTGVNEVTDDWRNAMRDGRAHPESAKRWLEREAGEGKVDPIQSLIAGASRVAAHLGEPITEMTLGGVKSPGLATIKPLPKPDPYAAHRENLAAAGIHSEEQIAWMTKSQPECQVKVAFTADTIPASREAGGVHPWDADDVEYES
jgi:hypothetical protein